MAHAKPFLAVLTLCAVAATLGSLPPPGPPPRGLCAVGWRRSSHSTRPCTPIACAASLRTSRNRVALLRRQQGLHPLFGSRSDQSRQRQESAHRLAAPCGERQADRRVPRYEAERVPARDAHHDRRRALHAGRTRPGDCARRRNRANDLGAAALRVRTREEAAGASTRGVDYWRGGGAATPTSESSRFAASISTPSMRQPACRCRRSERKGA